MKLTLEAVAGAGLHWPANRVSGPGAYTPPAELLTLLTYCYATGLHSSIDIELGAEQDAMIRYLCGRAVPKLPGIRNFRREYRARIKECLMTVLKRGWEMRFRDEAAVSESDSHHAGRSLERWEYRGRTPDFAADAERRILAAARADSMTEDE